MKLIIITPTYRPGGLDVLEATLMRQTFRNFVWMVADQRYDQRRDVWAKLLKRVDFPVIFIKEEVKKDNRRNLCRVYNKAAEYMATNGYEMLVSLQDYIYAPEDGLQKFINLNELHRDALLTGVTHISRDPYLNKVFDRNGKFTIFKTPYYEKPNRLSWEDVRVKDMYRGGDDVHPIETGHWEANWAAVPRSIIDAGIRWDETYDKGVAYENMDFAQQCAAKLGTKVIFDKTNVAISLPHKDYFEGEREEIENYSNRKYYERKWSI